MRVDESWRSNASESCNSHQLSSTLIISHPRLTGPLEVAFHHDICKKIVSTYVKREDSFFLLSYSETDELENSVLFCKKNPEVYILDTEMKSHPSGPVAVLCHTSITFL